MGCMHASWNEDHLPSDRLAFRPPGEFLALVGGGAAGSGASQPRRARVHAPIRGCTGQKDAEAGVSGMLLLCITCGCGERWPGCKSWPFVMHDIVASHRRLPQQAERQCMRCAAWLVPHRPLHTACPVAAPVPC